MTQQGKSGTHATLLQDNKPFHAEGPAPEAVASS